jgi:hypothetical protein
MTPTRVEVGSNTWKYRGLVKYSKALLAYRARKTLDYFGNLITNRNKRRTKKRKNTINYS